MNGSIIFLFLFVVCTVLIYMAIRRGWAPTPVATVIGIVLNSLLFMLYSLARGNIFLQAVFVGLLFGAIFTIAAVSIAAFFHNNPA